MMHVRTMMLVNCCRRALLALSAVGLVVGASAAQAEVPTFDDLGSSFVIPDGYAGFGWNTFATIDGVNYGSNPSGYQAGVISPNRVAVSWTTDLDEIAITHGTPFNFVGAYLTAAWRDGLSIRIRGLNNGVQVYDTTVNPSAVAATFFTFNYVNVDELRFSSFGGSEHIGYVGSGDFFAMDDFTYTAVPEPSACVLALTGVLGLLLRRRSRC